MRIASVIINGRPQTALRTGSGWKLSSTPGTTLLDVISGDTVSFGGAELTDSEVAVTLPYRPPTIFGIGLNYKDTVEEMGWDKPRDPYLFPKLSSSVVGPYDDVVVDRNITTRVDWETELGVVIGKSGKSIPERQALRHVFGYTIANDISSRDLQAQDGQWVRGKGLDTYCPLGPMVVTADEIDDPHDLRIRTRVNEKLMQDGNTADMIFSIVDLVTYCSRYFTLSPGDLILTGTPAGSGDFRDPPVSLSPGDRIEATIETLGGQSNSVVAPTKQQPVTEHGAG